MKPVLLLHAWYFIFLYHASELWEITGKVQHLPKVTKFIGVWKFSKCLRSYQNRVSSKKRRIQKIRPGIILSVTCTIIVTPKISISHVLISLQFEWKHHIFAIVFSVDDFEILNRIADTPSNV